jgi:hypothetical protein
LRACTLCTATAVLGVPTGCLCDWSASNEAEVRPDLMLQDLPCVSCGAPVVTLPPRRGWVRALLLASGRPRGI